MFRLDYFSDGVRAKIRALPNRIQKEVAEILLDLKDEPYPIFSEPLERELTGRYKIKVDGYRIIYQVKDDLVLVVDIRRRDRNTYLNVP